MDSDYERIVEGIITNEQSLSVLYAAFAQLFPDDSKLWLTLSREESLHAQWMRELDDYRKNGQVFQSKTSVTLKAVSGTLDYIRETQERCLQREITPIQALSVANDIETSILENKFLSVFDMTRAELSEVSKTISFETAEHKAKLLDALRKTKADS